MKSWKAVHTPLHGNFLENEGGFYEDAMKSQSFLHLNFTTKLGNILQDLQGAVEQSMTFYEQYVKSHKTLKQHHLMWICLFLKLLIV